MPCSRCSTSRRRCRMRPMPNRLRSSGGEIRFENVVFAYDPDRIVLKGISFSVPAGKTVAVVGPSGAGKSTISRILYRFYDMTDGRVTIDGQDIRDGDAGEPARLHRHRSAGHCAVQRYDPLQHRLWPHRRERGRDRAGRTHGPDRPLHPRTAARFRIHGRRARAQAVGWREAARGHCPHHSQEPADPAAG